MMTSKGFKRFQPEPISGSDQGLTLREWKNTDLRSSAISQTLIDANIAVIDSDSAIQALIEHAITQVQNVTSYFTKPAQQIRKRYDFAALGGWVAYGCTIDGESGEIAYFKPRNPRIDFEKRKPIKYETPAKCEALPILPFVDNETAQKIYQKYGVMALEGETFWRVVWRCNVPIVVSEGLKKALCLLTHGYAAIALRGVACWHRKGKTELHPVLKEFATEGRQIYICFDQDEKPKTITNVSRQINKLGAELQNHGCKVGVLVWNPKEGKGIDDAVFKQRESGQDWLDRTLSVSLTLAEFKKLGRTAQLLSQIKRLKALSVTPERITTGEFMPPLPNVEKGVIIALGANMGSGKTVRIGADLVQDKINQGWNVLVIGMLNSLGQQTAQRFGLPHIRDYTDQQLDLFLTEMNYKHGAVLCIDSLLKIPQWFLGNDDRPLLIVLDEVNQFCDHAIKGDTLGDKQSQVLQRFAEILRIAGTTGVIALAEAEVYNHSLNWIKSLSGCETVRYFQHKRIHHSWQVQIGSGKLSGFLNQFLLDAVSEAGLINQSARRFVWVTDSQANARLVERRLRREFPSKKVVRIDSHTNRQGQFAAFYDDPDVWLEDHQPDFLILSPSAKTGVSIEWTGFAAVYGYFVCLDSDTHLQLLARIRSNVPRYVCVPEFIHTIGDETLISPIAIQWQLELNHKALSSVYEIEAQSTESDEYFDSIKLAALEYYSRSTALRACQKAIARESLRYELEREGHVITDVEWGVNRGESYALKAAREEIDREDAQKMSVSGTYETVEAAYRTLASECSLGDEVKANKTIYRAQFPGIDFDDATACYWILTRQKGAMRRGVQLQASAENLVAAQELDRESTEKVLTNSLGLSHRLPKHYIRALLLNKLGILELANRDVELSNSDPQCIKVQQQALRFADQIRYFLGLTVLQEYTDEKGRKRHTPIEVCSKLLTRLNLKLRSIKRMGCRGARERIYRVAIANVPLEQQSEAWTYREKALEAARVRLSEICPLGLTDEPAPKAQQVLRNCRARDTQMFSGTVSPAIEFISFRTTSRIDPSQSVAR